MKRIRKWLAALLSAVLLLGLLPAVVLADEEDTSWATPAVTALNAVYGAGTFEATLEYVTASDVAAIFPPDKFSYTSNSGDFVNVAVGNVMTSDVLTRGGAARILTEIYNIPVPSGKTAIRHLYDLNIVSGYKTPNEEPVLGEGDPINQATFAVLTNRILNAVGGGYIAGDKNSRTINLKPGTKEYFSWMYLALRTCFGSSDTPDSTFTADTWKDSDGNGWEKQLTNAGKDPSGNGNAELDNSKITAAKNAVITDDTATASTLIEAAMKVVAKLEVTTLFSDVKPGEPWYDGIMYLFDHDIMHGFGNGACEPGLRANFTELAMLICRVEGKTLSVTQAINYVNINYLPDWSGDPNDRDHEPVTRAQAITGIFNMFRATRRLPVGSCNLDILKRFTDYESDISQLPAATQEALAYMVSLGIVGGYADGKLGPNDPANRGVVAILLYRTLLGVDTTKMQDYRENVENALSEAKEINDDQGHSLQSISLISPLADNDDIQVYEEEPDSSDPLAEEDEPELKKEITLTLTEDWRLTSDLELPGGYIWTIDGQGEYHIYEMGGVLKTADGDRYKLAPGTYVYPYQQPTATTPVDPGPSVDNDPNSTGGDDIYDYDTDDSSTPASAPAPSTTTTTTNADGSTTTKTTDRATGTVTETTNRPDGSVTVVETARNGTVTTKETAANGVEVTSVQARGASVTASVTIPDYVDSATVKIPAANLTPGTVAVNSKTGEVIKLSVVTADGMAVKLDHSADFVLVDRSRSFSDTTGHWAGDSVAFVTSHDLFNGTGDNTFAPEEPTTRAMLMTVLARLDSTASSSSISLDQGMAWAVAKGVSDGTDPNGQITREQLATMLWRYAGSPTSSYAVTSSDAGSISDYAQTAMAWAVQVGILTGYEDGTLKPDATATRAVVAAMVQRFCTTLV